MVILDEFVDFIKVTRIKMIAFYAEMSLAQEGGHSIVKNTGGGLAR